MPPMLGDDGSEQVVSQTSFGHISISFSMIPTVLTAPYHKWSLTICDGCFDTLNSSKMQS